MLAQATHLGGPVVALHARVPDLQVFCILSKKKKLKIKNKKREKDIGGHGTSLVTISNTGLVLRFTVGTLVNVILIQCCGSGLA